MMIDTIMSLSLSLRVVCREESVSFCAAVFNSIHKILKEVFRALLLLSVVSKKQQHHREREREFKFFYFLFLFVYRVSLIDF